MVIELLIYPETHSYTTPIHMYIIKEVRTEFLAGWPRTEKIRIIFYSHSKTLTENKLKEVNDLLNSLKNKQIQKANLIQNFEAEIEGKLPILKIIKQPEWKLPLTRELKIKKKEIGEHNTKVQKEYNDLSSKLRQELKALLSQEDKDLMKWKSKKNYAEYSFVIEEVTEKKPFEND